MASRLANKINRQAVHTICKSLCTSSPEVGAAATHNATNQTSHADQSSAVPVSESASVQSIPAAPYQVCRPRNVPLATFGGGNVPTTSASNEVSRQDADNDTELIRKHAELRALQPSRLPDYYQPATDFPPCVHTSKQSATVRASTLEAGKKEGSDTYPTFAESMTYRNLTQPLKGSKMASPFPEPVKMMPSHQVSDKEKAAQMFADSRSYGNSGGAPKGSSVTDNYNKQQQYQQQVRNNPMINITRNYSKMVKTEKGKCKKMNQKKREFCKKLLLKNCKQAEKISCDTNTYVYKKCGKKEAPYPSYSESCFIDPYDKPSECNMCPWKNDAHPTFKPKKKGYHTSTRQMHSSGSTENLLESMQLRKKVECPEPTELHKVPCGWVKLDKEADNQRILKNKYKKPKAGKDDKKAMAAKLEIAEQLQELALERKKVPCKQQSGHKCPAGSTDIVPKSKKNTPRQKYNSIKNQKIPFGKEDNDGGTCKLSEVNNSSEPDPDPEPVAGLAVGQSIDSWLTALTLDENSAATSLLAHGCKKFPFKEMRFDLVKNRKVRSRIETHGTCEKKKRKLDIKDCPGPKKENCLSNVLTSMVLKKNKVGKGNCPRVNVGVCKDPSQEDDDPCKRKRKGKSEVCPGDLLDPKRNRKPKKKCSEGVDGILSAKRASNPNVHCQF